MFIAYGPAGYILAVSLLQRLRDPGIAASLVIGAGGGGGVFPDLDLLYFSLVDNRQTHHHKYLMHRPSVWLGPLAGFDLGAYELGLE